MMLLLLLIISCFCCISCRSQGLAPVAEKSTAGVCDWLINSRGLKLSVFAASPGNGFDNLRNIEKGQVANISIEDCRLSSDGRLIIPNLIELLPLKESQVAQSVEIFDTHKDYKSTQSLSINLAIDYSAGPLSSINGKLSREYDKSRQTTLKTKTTVTRIEMRQRMYKARLKIDFPLAPAFRDRMFDIVTAVVVNDTAMARYLSDLVIRDYGTHIITSTDAGGILQHTNYVDKEEMEKITKAEFETAMSASFKGFLGIKFSLDINKTLTNEQTDTFKRSVVKSETASFGGPILGVNKNVTHWELGLRDNLVPIDRAGVPLYFVINQRSLPTVPVNHLAALVAHLQEGAKRYYKANEHVGCTDPKSGNFDPIANIDGECAAANTNFTFGGIYQTCRDRNPSANLNLCNKADGASVQKNPITGGYSCPNGYESVKLLEIDGASHPRCNRHCYDCGSWWNKKRCCDPEVCVYSNVIITIYWCSAMTTARITANSGMVYGGIYSESLKNRLTQGSSCPENFREYKFATDMQICLSRDFSATATKGIPLGGFFSCDSGNPMAGTSGSSFIGNTDSAASSDSSIGVDEVRLPRLVNSFGSRGSKFNVYKRSCPKGYSQTTAAIIKGCELMSCERATSKIEPIVVRSPPFELPQLQPMVDRDLLVSDSGRTWWRSIKTKDWSLLGSGTKS